MLLLKMKKVSGGFLHVDIEILVELSTHFLLTIFSIL